MGRIVALIVMLFGLCIAGAGAWARFHGVPFNERVAPVSITNGTGLAFSASLPRNAYFVPRADVRYQGSLSGSDMRLFENGHALGPAHSERADIEALGRGRYLYSTDGLYFSSSDGSDPRTNGRTYGIRFRGYADRGWPKVTLRTMMLAGPAVSVLLLLGLLMTQADLLAQEDLTAAGHASGGEKPSKNTLASGIAARARRTPKLLVALLKPRSLLSLGGLTIGYALVMLVILASITAQNSATGKFQINFEYRVF